MALVSAAVFRGFDLRYDELNSRLKAVKKEFGMRRAVSTRSLTGETRTFAEILDQQVETIVLYYLEIQGILAKQTRELRDRTIRELQDLLVSLDGIESLCQRYREIGSEMVELLNYLERNSIALGKILRRHDSLFDQKMGHMYFDTRLSGNAKNSQLRQLYHQEGIRAMMGSLRRGFEELYDARKALIESIDGDFTFSPFTASSSNERWSAKNKPVPRISFKKRMQSFSHLPALHNDLETPNAPANINRTKSASFSMDATSYLSDNSTRQRTLSDLEPVLSKVDQLANRLMKTQSSTSLEFLSTHSSLGLELKMWDLRREGSDGDSTEGAEELVKTDRIGLQLNLVLTFLYLANQYVVAPSSAEYAKQLGMGEAMSGLIIGLAPLAALGSSLVYSMWSNYSYKPPLLCAVAFAIAGNVLYGMALQYDSPVLLLVGRLLTGCGGPRGVSRRYIADHVALEDRLLASTQFVTAGALGLACGPLLAAAIDRSGLRFRIRYGGLELLRYDALTACGWLMALAWAATFIGVLFLFQEPSQRRGKGQEEGQGEAERLLGAHAGSYGTSNSSSSKPPHPAQNIVYVESGNELWAQEQPPPSSTPSSTSSRPSRFSMLPSRTPSPLPLPTPSLLAAEVSRRRSLLHPTDPLYDLPEPPELSGTGTGCWAQMSAEVLCILLIYLVNKAGQELTVSSMPLLLQQLFRWDSQAIGYYMALIGALVLPGNLMLSLLREREEREMLRGLTWAALLACLLLALASSLWMYVLGTVLLFTALNSLEGIIMALLAKLISPSLAKGTFNSGLLATEAGTLGRVLGDMAITVVGERALGQGQGQGLLLQLFIPIAALLLLCAGVIYRYYDKLID